MFQSRLEGLVVPPEKCLVRALELVDAYLVRDTDTARKSATPSSGDTKYTTSSNTSTTRTDINARVAASLYEEVFGRPPSSAMMEVLELKTRSKNVDPATMRVFLRALKDDADRVAGPYLRSPSIGDPLYSGLASVQPRDSSSSSFQMDKLKSVVCTGAIPRGEDAHRETLLADLMQGRNRLHLLNLCKRGVDKSTPEEANLNEKRLSGSSAEAACCDDGTKWILSSSKGGTPLELAHATNVGSIMPRFVYAEYV